MRPTLALATVVALVALASSTCSSSDSNNTPGQSACLELCTSMAQMPATQEACVGAELTVRGYDVDNTAECALEPTETNCKSCVAKLALKEADCTATRTKCIGTTTGDAGPKTDSGSTGVQITDCAGLCARFPVSDTQETCIGQLLEGLGYAVSTTAECDTVGTAQTCVTCLGALGVPDAQCAKTGDECIR